MSILSQEHVSLARRERRATLGAFIGNAIEWYDFFIFGTAAALVFNRVFFPSVDPGTALLASFATLWVGFLARPLGAVVFGHLGDKFGRKSVLVATLVLMGVSTTLIGLLPTYDQVGILAPVSLVVLRALQGVAVGGEWGGAVLMATENAHTTAKSTAGAWVQQGSPTGSILATGAFLAVGTLPDDQFYSWGWRIPFLVSIILVVVGLVIRMKVEESVEFVESKNRRATVKWPVLEVARIAPKTIALGFLASAMAISMAYFLNTFLLSWTTTTLGIERQTMLNILLGAAVVQFIAQPTAAYVATKVGPHRVMVGGLTLTLVAVIPFFLAIGSANVLHITITLFVSMIGACSYFAMLASTLAASFPAHVRYSGVSIAYQLCSSLIGGSTPLLAQWILNMSADGRSTIGVGLFYSAILLVTMLGVAGLVRQAGAHTGHDRRGDLGSIGAKR
jgi:MFS family permease